MSGELTGLKPAALPTFTEVEVSTGAVSVPPAALPLMMPPGAPPASCAVSPVVPGQIGIALPSGVWLTVDASVDADALTRVLAVLGR